ncbi:MAG: hypothetical protein ACJAS1_005099 [Oleiphilaceae bacterium]|jgi:hypothetical protein
MSNTKLGVQVNKFFPTHTKKVVLNSLVAITSVYIFIYLFALIRVISQSIPFEYLLSDDYFWIALFISLWCLLPAIPAAVIEQYKGDKGRRVAYLIITILQFIALKVSVYLMHQDPMSEVDSSALPLLIWLVFPLSALFYPLYFRVSEKSKWRVFSLLIGGTLIIISSITI